MKTEKEIEVLNKVLAETKRFEKRLKELINECKTDNKHQSVKRSAVKRSALDLKNELSKITTAIGTNKTYYYRNNE